MLKLPLKICISDWAVLTGSTSADSFTSIEFVPFNDAESDKISESSLELLFENKTKAPAIKIAQMTTVRHMIIKFLLSEPELEFLLELFEFELSTLAVGSVPVAT